MTKRQLDGSHAWTALQPQYVPTLLEEHGIPADEPMGSIAERYHNAVQGFIDGRLSEAQMFRVISARACLPDRR